MEFVCKGDDLGELFGEEDEGSCEDGVGLRVGKESKGGYYAEVLACASDRPEEVCVLVFGCCGYFA